MDSFKTPVVKKLSVLLLLAIAMTLSLGVGMLRGTPVELVIDGESKSIVAYASNIEELLVKEGITLAKDAKINPALDSLIEKDMKIEIINPYSYTIVQGEKELPIVAYGQTVGEILSEAKITLSPNDYTEPALTARPKPNSTIKVYRVVYELKELNDAIPFEREVINNIRLDKGVVNELQKGEDGVKRTYIKEVYVDGVLTSSVVLRETITKEPVSHVIEQGTNSIIKTSRGDTRFRETMVLQATAYDLSFASTGKRPGDKYWGITATGTRARPGTVAVDPRVIPLGTKLYVQSLDSTPDYGFAIAEDVGGAIKGKRIDLFFNTAREVRNFGRRNVKVYILE